MGKERMKFEYESEYGGTYSLSPWIDQYANNNNLALGFDFYDEEFEDWEPYCYATVNVGALPYLHSAIDINDNGRRFVDFLVSNGFAEMTPYSIPSGFSVFPVMRFKEECLKEIDPETFAKYQKSYGMDKPSLSVKITDAQAKAGTPGPNQQGKEAVR